MRTEPEAESAEPAVAKAAARIPEKASRRIHHLRWNDPNRPAVAAEAALDVEEEVAHLDVEPQIRHPQAVAVVEADLPAGSD